MATETETGGTAPAITLYRFGPAFGLVDPSPFCTKVELYLRAAGLEYTEAPGVTNLRRAPKGKLPYIRDQGHIIADSAVIIDHLKRTRGDPLDHDLHTEQQAVAHAFGRMLEEHLYWALIYGRWLDAELWPRVREAYFGGLPFPLRQLIPMLARHKVWRDLHGHGMGRHSRAEILRFAMQDLAALATLLGDRRWFFNDWPSTLDITAYAFLAGLYCPQLPGELQRRAECFDNLRAFVDRIDRTFYGGP